MTVLRGAAKTGLRLLMRVLPLDSLLLLSQRFSAFVSALLMLRDWRLEAFGRPQFFKHEVNLGRWRFEPARWAFTARGVYAREAMFKGCLVLDLCCGDGSNSYLFFADVAGHIDAVDNDESSLAYAKRFHAHPSIHYQRINIVNQPLPARKYDFVVWNAAICYFSETEIKSILQKVAGAGRPGMIFRGMLPAASGYADHKTEFQDTKSVRALLDEYFGDVQVHEIAEAVTRTFYFKAREPLRRT
jgi:SAM-dependent methyltransferase